MKMKKLLLLVFLMSFVFPCLEGARYFSTPSCYSKKIVTITKKKTKKNKKKKKLKAEDVKVTSDDYHRFEKRLLKELKEFHALQGSLMSVNSKSEIARINNKIKVVSRSLKREFKDIAGVPYSDDLSLMHKKVDDLASQKEYAGKNKYQILSDIQKKQYDYVQKYIHDKARERKIRMAED